MSSQKKSRLGRPKDGLRRRRLNAHNAAFDSRVLINEGLLDRGHPDIWDTLILAKNSSEGSCPLGLDFTSQRWVEELMRLWKNDVDHAEGDTIESDVELWAYNGKDVLAQKRMLKPLKAEIRKCRTRRQAAQDMRLMPIARDMGDLGLPILESVRQDYALRLRKDVRRVRKELRQIVGKKKFNPNSSAQVSDWLYEKKKYTPQINTASDPWQEGDPYSSGIPALMALQDTVPPAFDPELHKFIELQIRYKSWMKLLTSYLDNQADLPVHECGDEYRVLRPQFKLSIPSGRWASSPNVQNWPKRAVINMRRMVVAPPGHVFICLDLDQAELRVLAEAAEDELDIRTILEGQDPHTMCAAGLLADSEADMHRRYTQLEAARANGDESIESIRLNAKVFRFACAYGAGMERLMIHMSTARNKATGERLFPGYTTKRNRKNYQRFHKWHPHFRQWHRRMDAFVDRHGYAEDIFKSRKRYFPGGQSSPNEGRNHNIQCTIGNVMNDAVEEVAHEIPHRGWSRHSGLFIQVHDELGVIVPESRAEEAYAIMKRAMYRKLGVLDLTADGKITRVWTGPDIRKEA